MKNWLAQLGKNEKGVTLIELLVVVVILGIIAAVAIPAVMSNQEDAYANTNLQNLKIVQEAVERYAIDHGGKYPVNNNSLTILRFNKLTNKTVKGGAVDVNGKYGPYLQEAPTVYDGDGNSLAGVDWTIDSNGKVTLPIGAAQ